MAAYYLAPPGSGGSDSNLGTEASPWATIGKFHTAAALPGDICYMRGGLFTVGAEITLTKDGTSGNRITLQNYPGETPILDGTTMTGGAGNWIIFMNGANWWHIKGLELRNNSQFGGIEADNCSNCIFELNNFHHNKWTGLFIGGSSSNNEVLNNDSHDNADPPDYGDADGFACVSDGTGNIWRGNRAWGNSDDGFDTFNGSNMLCENNWAWENGYREDGVTAGGNGNGFKFGGDGVNSNGSHTIRNNLSWKNRTRGYVDAGAVSPSTWDNNTAWSNAQRDWEINAAIAHVVRNNIAHAGGAVLINAAVLDTFNTWNLGVTVTNGDFESMDDSGADGPRNADGSLPTLSFLRLAAGSDLIDAGTDVGLPFSGAAPDLGAYERIADNPLPINDEFNRASLGSDWQATSNSTLPVISGNRLRVGVAGSTHNAFYNAATFPADQQAQVTLTTWSGSFEANAGILLRGSGSTYYLARAARNVAAHTTQIAKTVNGTFSSILIDTSVTWVAGDVLLARVIGTTISIYRNGVLVISASDSAIATGKPGVVMLLQSGSGVGDVELDSWTGDEAATPVAASVVGRLESLSRASNSRIVPVESTGRIVNTRTALVEAKQFAIAVSTTAVARLESLNQVGNGRTAQVESKQTSGLIFVRPPLRNFPRRWPGRTGVRS